MKTVPRRMEHWTTCAGLVLTHRTRLACTSTRATAETRTHHDISTCWCARDMYCKLYRGASSTTNAPNLELQARTEP
eukprot:1504426-Pyramimonas_sp.AAC.2